MQRTNKTAGGSDEDGCKNPGEQRDQECDADLAAVTEAGQEQAALNVAAALEFNPAYVKLRFGPDLLVAALDAVGVAGWNNLLRRLRQANVVFSTIGMEDVPPVIADLNFSGINLGERNLDGIDLRYITLDGADLSKCSLRGARFWCVRHVSFRCSDLSGARFEAPGLSGADFTGAELHDATIEDADYCAEDPPIGMPPQMLAICRSISKDHPVRRVEAMLTRQEHDHE
jgi:hypothetical protein